MLDFLSHHWLLLAFIAPLFWALVNIVDVYFVSEVYKDELDGTIITGLFQVIPFFILGLFFLKINIKQFINLSPGNGIITVDPLLLLGFLGGFLFTSSFFFYFKALFKQKDVAFLQIIWGLTIIAVPILAFLFWGEKLPIVSYAGMGLTLAGAIFLSFNKSLRNKLSFRYLAIMLSAVIIFSLSMVFEDRVYGELTLRGFGDQGFLLGFLCFSLGSVFCGLFFAILSKRNPIPLIKEYGHIFILLEGITFFGNLSSQRAISVAPSVSFVATIETFVPVFVMVFSLIILFYFSFILAKRTKTFEKIYREQLDGIWIKIIATVIMAMGVYIIST